MQQLWSSDASSTSSAFLDSEDFIVLPKGSQMVSLFFFLVLTLSYNAHLAADSWRLCSFMLIHNILMACLYHLFKWLAAPGSKGVINQNKAVLHIWQLWWIGEVAQADWVCQVKVMTVIWKGCKEPLMVHCTYVIDNVAGNGYLLSYMECVGTMYIYTQSRHRTEKTNQYIFLSLLSNANAPLACPIMNHRSMCYAVTQWAWLCAQEPFVKLLLIVQRLYYNVQK